MKRYMLLAEEAYKTNKIKYYNTDLFYHDAKRLSEDLSLNIFGWILREYGTELLDVRMSVESLEGYIDHYKGDTNNLYYFFDGNILTEYSLNKWCEVMREANQKATLQEASEEMHIVRSYY